MKLLVFFFTVGMMLFLAGCASFTIKPVDYTWLSEDVFNIQSNGMVDAKRNFKFNAKPLLFEELQDSLHFENVEIRIIRNQEGFFFMVAAKFKNVYVFKWSEGALSLKKKIPVSKEGLKEPFFVQHQTYIEVKDKVAKPVKITADGVIEGGGK